MSKIMETEGSNTNIESPKPLDNAVVATPKKLDIPMPIALVIAAVLIAGAIFGSKYITPTGKQSIAKQVGLSDTKMQACINSGETKDAVEADIASGDRAFAHLPNDQKGTPYSVAVAKDGKMVQIQGALPFEAVKPIIDSLLAGTAKTEKIDLDPVTDEDHILGSKDAQVVIVEYSDFECPFCYRFRPTMQKVMETYGDKVAWVYRNYPLTIHEHAYIKAQAAECAAKIGGNDAFWKYGNALFDSLAPKDTFDTTSL
jgi:protein-disulfide isomerase